MRCISCKIGTTRQSGSFMFCDNCGYTTFTLTNDYLEACGRLMGTLISNVAYRNDEAFAKAVAAHVISHLPMLDAYIAQIEYGAEEFVGQLLELAKEHAINLRIENTVVNETVLELTCCGHQDFKPVGTKISELQCLHCYSKWLYDTDQGIYQPEFLCECGSIHYDPQELGMVTCSVCRILYMHNTVDNIYMRVADGT